jgi:RNA polymerase sigma-70 factor, ECF subfamily
MPLVDKTDEELMTLYQGGSEEAFKVLYGRYANLLYGYLKLRCESAQEAGDLFQEVFVKMHKSKHLYQAHLPLKPWIFSITRSALIDAFRKRSRNREAAMDLDVLHSASAEAQESSQAISELTKQLSGNQAKALFLRYGEEKSFAEIADILETSSVNVRKILSRGIEKLRVLKKRQERDK